MKTVVPLNELLQVRQWSWVDFARLEQPSEGLELMNGWHLGEVKSETLGLKEKVEDHE